MTIFNTQYGTIKQGMIWDSVYKFMSNRENVTIETLKPELMVTYDETNLNKYPFDIRRIDSKMDFDSMFHVNVTDRGLQIICRLSFVSSYVRLTFHKDPGFEVRPERNLIVVKEYDKHSV